ncbi:C-3',4' desaturase CrtD [Bacillus ectoiniformans]|nr:C-3',4' desaturase CrtD [Bacillus ectoiniformans]
MIIIGGGVAGLTAAAMLANDGHQVTVLEQSREWGGCAGKFSRKKFLFPVGATLGMGFEEGGIHERIFNHLHIPMQELPVQKLEEVMNIHLPNKTITFHRDRNEHVESLVRAFPEHKQKIMRFYQKLYEIAAKVRALMVELPVLPPQTRNEWLGLLHSLNVSSLTLLPYFPKTVGHLLKKFDLLNTPFKHFIDGQLIDSMQVKSEQCACILGCLALDIYHEGAFYVEGGLYQVAHRLADHAKGNGGVLMLGRKAERMVRTGNKWTVTDHRGNDYRADHVISSLPVQVLPDLLSETDLRSLGYTLRKKTAEETWRTMTLYLTLKETDTIMNMPLFQQICTSESGEMSEGNHIFMSLSNGTDRVRAPEGYRTMTVSTHIDLSYWKAKEEYDKRKIFMQEKMIAAILSVYPDFKEAVEQVECGAPKAWERYTGRPGGMVGGFGQSRNNSLFFSLSHRTKLPNFWLCGDSIFPGAGTIGVSVGAYHVYSSITGKKLSQ